MGAHWFFFLASELCLLWTLSCCTKGVSHTFLIAVYKESISLAVHPQTFQIRVKSGKIHTFEDTHTEATNSGQSSEIWEVICIYFCIYPPRIVQWKTNPEPVFFAKALPDLHTSSMN